MKEKDISSSQTLIPNLDVRVVVFCLINEHLQVLVTPWISKGLADQEPGENWELPGDIVPYNQSLEDIATESVLKLTGLREAFLEQLYTYGEVSRCPDHRLVTVVYFAIIPAGVTQHSPSQPGKDHKIFLPRWFPVEKLPALSMDYLEVVAYALRRLRYKLEYTAIGFQLLPEYFSLSELQQTYEMILSEKLDKRNFRRRILQAGIIEETDRLRSGEGRPARLFRYQPDAVAEIRARRLFP